jgi:arylsulfatase A-like enzyme
MYLAFQSVHSPLQAPQQYQNMYPNLTGNYVMRNAMVSAMDDQVGNITATLKATGQMENTIIVFTSDNGTPYELAYSMGDEKNMAEALGFEAHGDRPPPAPSTGGGSNYPFTGKAKGVDCFCMTSVRDQQGGEQLEKEIRVGKTLGRY